MEARDFCSGQGTRADADRSRAELALRRIDVARSEEAVAVVSARLAQAISIDGSMQIVPIETSVTPINIVPLDESSQNVLEREVSHGRSKRPQRWKPQYCDGPRAV